MVLPFGDRACDWSLLQEVGAAVTGTKRKTLEHADHLGSDDKRSLRLVTARTVESFHERRVNARGDWLA